MTGDDRRVVRGGSWDLNLVDARAAYRYSFHPGFRYDLLGFRVVCLSPILS
jgi:formylglycine-generating enzyme required for sulfatase activity